MFIATLCNLGECNMGNGKIMPNLYGPIFIPFVYMQREVSMSYNPIKSVTDSHPNNGNRSPTNFQIQKWRGQWKRVPISVFMHTTSTSTHHEWKWTFKHSRILHLTKNMPMYPTPCTSYSHRNLSPDLSWSNREHHMIWRRGMLLGNGNYEWSLKHIQ